MRKRSETECDSSVRNAYVRSVTRTDEKCPELVSVYTTDLTLLCTAANAIQPMQCIKICQATLLDVGSQPED